MDVPLSVEPDPSGVELEPVPVPESGEGLEPVPVPPLDPVDGFPELVELGVLPDGWFEVCEVPPLPC